MVDGSQRAQATQANVSPSCYRKPANASTQYSHRAKLPIVATALCTCRAKQHQQQFLTIHPTTWRNETDQYLTVNEQSCTEETVAALSAARLVEGYLELRCATCNPVHGVYPEQPMHPELQESRCGIAMHWYHLKIRYPPHLSTLH